MPPSPRADRFAYLHGFASGPTSRKGSALAAAFRARGATFHQPDLNVPSFARLTYSGMLCGVDALDAAVSTQPGDHSTAAWGFVGSSMGGLVAARWAELHPQRVRRLLLLAPGFDLPNRWRTLISAEDLARWEATGAIDYRDAAGVSTPLHWGFMLDARAQPSFPSPRCPTLILHGRRDSVVPFEVSVEYARKRPNVELEALDDDHDLLATLPFIERRALEWFGVG